MNDNLKTHLYDLGKAVLAAAAVALAQGILAWLGNIHIGAAGNVASVLAALGAIKGTRG